MLYPAVVPYLPSPSAAYAAPVSPYGATPLATPLNSPPGTTAFGRGVRFGLLRGVIPTVVAPALTPLASMSFSPGSYYQSAAGAFAAVPVGAFRCRVRINAIPAAGYKQIAGFNPGSPTGFEIATSEVTSGVISQPQFLLYAGIDGVITKIGQKAPMPEEVGSVVTLSGSFEGGRVHFFVDGHEVANEPCDVPSGVPLTGMGVPYTAYGAPAGPLTIGADSGGGSSSDLEIVEFAISATALTPSQILADAQLPIGSPMVGESHGWTVTLGLGAVWADRTGAINLTRTGAPTTATHLALLNQNVGASNVFGDSIDAGSSPLGDGAGYRISFEQRSLLLARGVSLVGRLAPVVVPQPFDAFHNAVGGQQLQTALATAAADLVAWGSPLTDAVGGWAINDFLVGGRTAAQVAADWSAYCAIYFAQRPTARLVIRSTMPVSDGSGANPARGTAPQRAENLAYIAGFSAMIASLRAAFPGKRIAGANVSTAMSNPNSLVWSWDGLHPTDATYALMGPIVAAAYASV